MRPSDPGLTAKYLSDKANAPIDGGFRAPTAMAPILHS
jgi:hypothetical protein